MSSRGKTFEVDGATVVVSYLAKSGSRPSRVRVVAADGKVVGFWDFEQCGPVVDDPADASLVIQAALAWESERPRERDLFRVRPGARPDGFGQTNSDPRQRAVQSPPSKAMTQMPEPRPEDDLALNKPAQQLLAWRKERWRKNRLAVLKGFFSGVGDPDYRRITLGIHGERVVARELGLFVGRHPGWQVLHSIRLNSSGRDVDHLVIGPSGVYTINAKHWNGSRITGRRHTLRRSCADGSRRFGDGKPIRAALDEGRRVGQRLAVTVGLEIPVRPIVVFVGATEVRDELSDDGVRLLSLDKLQSWFDAETVRPAAFTADEVLALHRAARHRKTWSS